MTMNGSMNSLQHTYPWSPEMGTWCECRPVTCSVAMQACGVRLDAPRERWEHVQRPPPCWLRLAGRKRVVTEWTFAAHGMCASPRGLRRCSAAAVYGRLRWVRCYTPGGEPGFMMGVQLAIRGVS